jgi:hypothetical protein
MRYLFDVLLKNFYRKQACSFQIFSFYIDLLRGHASSASAGTASSIMVDILPSSGWYFFFANRAS